MHGDAERKGNRRCAGERLNMKKALICAASVLTAMLGGCGPAPDMRMYEQKAGAKEVQIQDNPRIKVTRVGVFKDDVAYNDRRGVYVIQDTTTGREYIGVSGIGISELGSHTTMAGKVAVTHQDER